jgi:hypothetical protein
MTIGTNAMKTRMTETTVLPLLTRLHCYSKHCAQVLFVLGTFALLPKAQATPLFGFNTADGQNALSSVTTGVANTGIGWFSLKSDTDGSFNTAVGAGTLLLNIGDQSTGEGVENTAVGATALLFNTTGSENTANGTAALQNNTTGDFNTATGAEALFNNTTANANTANGFKALFSNSTGVENTAMGADALLSNSNGSFNTATGVNALAENADGGGNTASGVNALANNTIGNFNTANGFEALGGNDTGAGNAAIGRGALANNTAGNGNTALGTNAGNALTTGNFNIDIGVDVIGVAGESNTIRIGANLDDTQGASACHIGGIYNQLVNPATASSMAIDATGKLGTAVSSRRFKHDIKPMEKASEAILTLKPVTFHYKSDAKNTPCFGLIAEEVAEVNPDLVVRNGNGEIWSVRYDAVNAMLLNEFLKEHRKAQEQQATITELKSTVAKQEKAFEATIAQLAARLKEQDSKIQKVSDQVEASKAAPRVVLNNQ